MKPRSLAAWLLLIVGFSGCTQPDEGLVLLRPYFAALLDVPNLTGEVIVSREREDGSLEEIGRGTLALEGETAQAQLPGLPADRDLHVEVVWKSGTVLIATVKEPKVVRLEREKQASLAFGASDYLYPDDDGDGAANIYEVVWEADNPGAGANACNDPDLTPTGFFDGIREAVSLPGYSLYLQVKALGAEVMVPTFDLQEGAGGGVEFYDHRLHVIGLGNRERYSLDLDCSPQDAVRDVRVNYGVDPVYSAVLCAGRVHFIERDFVTQLKVARSTDVPLDGTRITYGRLGKRLYLFRLAAGVITVLDSNPTSPTYGQVLEDISALVLGEGAKPIRLVDTGDRLIISDEGREALVVVSHQDGGDYQLAGVALMGQLALPEDVVLHPAGHRAYVANRDDGLLRVVDITPQHPIDWKVVDEIEVANQLSILAIEPVYGNWLYAMSPHRIVRVDTLTNQIGWRQSLGDETGGRGVVYHLALSEDGMWGAATAADSRGVLVLGKTDARNSELEPNNGPQQLDGSANVLGPPPGLAVGYGDIEDAGSLSFEHFAMDATQTIDFTEDIEDLWLLDAGQASGRLAIAVQPTDGMARMNLTLIEPTGNVIDKAIYPLQPTPLSVGTGVFMITPVASELSPGTMIGVGTLDFDRSINYSPYELLIIEVPASLNTIAEQEPNNNAEQAPVLVNLPVVVEGLAEGSDQGDYIVYGNEDAEDCYKVRVDNIRLGVRLDSGPDDDLDLFVLNLDGSRVPLQYGIIGSGQSEFVIFEPHIQEPFQYLVCVNIEGTRTADYTLTLVDFDL